MKHVAASLLPVVMVVLLIFSGCEKDTNITNIIENTSLSVEQRATEEGWKAYRAQNFSQAVDSFRFASQVNSLYLDAYCGLGWAYGKLDSLEKASENFSVCMVSDQNEHIYKDACAGRSFVNLAMGNYTRAITDARQAWMEIVDPEYNIWGYGDYIFRHLPSINEKDLALVMAESYFMLGYYDDCFDFLYYIDGSIETTYEPEELALIIEQMKSTI